MERVTGIERCRYPLTVGKLNLYIRQSIIVTLMLLTFVSQTFAAAILPCTVQITSCMPVNESVTGTSMKMHELTTSAHTSSNLLFVKHLSSADVPNINGHDECCHVQCYCEQGSCVSIALNMALPVLISLPQGVQPSSILSLHVKIQYLASLYRPPITTLS